MSAVRRDRKQVRRDGQRTRRDGARIRYRCRACGFAFTDAIAGTVACPRCHSIADHEQLGRHRSSIDDAD